VKRLSGSGCHFGVASAVGQEMDVLDGLAIVERKGQFWGEFGASHCNQWGQRRTLPNLLLLYLIISDKWHKAR